MSEAETFFKLIKKEDFNSRSDNSICLTATNGLFHYRKGYPDIGRKLYLEALRISKEEGYKELNSLAFINFTREEILLGEQDVSELIPRLHEIIKYKENQDLVEDAKDVLLIYNSRK